MALENEEMEENEEIIENFRIKFEERETEQEINRDSEDDEEEAEKIAKDLEEFHIDDDPEIEEDFIDSI